MKKYNLESRVRYLGRDFKYSIDHAYNVKRIFLGTDGVFYHDLESVIKPEIPRFCDEIPRHHSQYLHSIPYNELEDNN